MLAILLLTGCLDAPEYVYGEDLDAMRFEMWTRDVGVYPDNSVLLDPNNPFAGVALGTDVQYDLVGNQAWVPSFYAWASLLATSMPVGEAQYYTASSLAGIYNRELYEDPDDEYFVWRNAVDGFQVVLDEFPDSVTYDATGTVPYRLAPLAYFAIEALGAEPQGDWIVVTDGDGNTTVVSGS